MPKGLQNQERTFDKGIIPRQILIVPNELSLQGWQMDGEPDEGKQDAARPVTREKLG